MRRTISPLASRKDAHDNRRMLEHYQRLAHRLVAAGGQASQPQHLPASWGHDATNRVFIVVHPCGRSVNTGEMAPVVGMDGSRRGRF